MNVAVRKLAMLEKAMAQQEENARIQGYTSNVVDSTLKKNVTELMDKIRVL